MVYCSMENTTVRIQTQTLRRKAQEKPPHGIPILPHRLPSADALHRAEEQLLTAFEAGKTYHYSVYAYTRELFTVFAADAKLVLNGETIAVPVMEAPDSTFVAQYVKELTPRHLQSRPPRITVPPESRPPT